MTDQSNTYVEAIDCDAKGGDGWIRKVNFQRIQPQMTSPNHGVRHTWLIQLSEGLCNVTEVERVKVGLTLYDVTNDQPLT